MTAYIGIADLTVRLSSMNPLNLIDVNGANAKLEQRAITACRHVYDKARTDAEKRALERLGIVREGAAAKYFELEDAALCREFLIKLRSALLQDALPFKICVRLGELTRTTLKDQWRDVMSAAKGSEEPAKGAALKVLSDQFGVVDTRRIETMFELYRASSLKDDGAQLSLDFESFKGLGIALDVGPSDPIHAIGAGTFRNHYPVRRRANAFDPVEYFDLLFADEPDDVVERFIGTEFANDLDEEEGPASDSVTEEVMPAGMGSIIDQVFLLLSRSVAADPAHAGFYISILTTLVRSGSYQALTYLSRPEGGSGRRRASGWQKAPPIFGAVLTRRKNLAILTKIVGIELVVGSLVDEVYSAVAGQPSSAAAVRTGDNAGVVETVKADDRMQRLVKAIHAAYGPTWLRKVLNLPEAVLSAERKRVLLAVVTAP
jgi:hypothetical protein